MAAIILAAGELPQPGDQLDQEITDHEIFARERRNCFTGRTGHFDVISRYLDNPRGRLPAPMHISTA